jgi:hypothetical protein
VRLAVANNDLDIVNLLLAAGADPLLCYNKYLYRNEALYDGEEFRYADWSPIHEGAVWLHCRCYRHHHPSSIFSSLLLPLLRHYYHEDAYWLH